MVSSVKSSGISKLSVVALGRIVETAIAETISWSPRTSLIKIQSFVCNTG